MKYLKTYEALEDTYTGKSIFYIVTSDEEYVLSRGPRTGNGNFSWILHPIKELKNKFLEPFAFTEAIAKQTVERLQHSVRRGRDAHTPYDAGPKELEISRRSGSDRISASTLKIVEYMMGAIKRDDDPDLGLDDENLGMDI